MTALIFVLLLLAAAAFLGVVLFSKDAVTKLLGGGLCLMAVAFLVPPANALF